MSEGANGETKAMVDESALKRTVQSVPRDEWGMGGQLLSLTLATVADDLPPWGTSPYVRDRMLREFWPTESILAGTIYSASIRNSSMNLAFEGPPRTVKAVQTLFNSANLGKGQLDFFTKLVTDLLTQDNGAHFELIRESDSENAPVIGINHLDSQRCRRTGNIDIPIVYTDRLGGQHKLKWYQVISLAEMPSPIEVMNGMQYCFVTRVLRAAQVLRDMAIYKREKIGGRGPTDIHLVGGVAQSRIDDKLKIDHEKADNKGLIRYMDAMVVAGLDPTQTVSLASIPIKSLPDGFDEDTTLKWYVAWLALNAGMDYQDLAPLPGGGLGTSQQSVTLDRKSRGKGPAYYQKMILQALNFHGVIPSTVTAKYDEQDNAAALDEANLKKVQAEYYGSLITTSGMPKQVVYQMMSDDGFIDEEILQLLEQADVTEDVIATDTTPYDEPENVQSIPTDTPPESPALNAQAQPAPTEAKEIVGAVFDYASDLGGAVKSALVGKLTAKRLERSHKSYLTGYAREAYLEGMAEGGVEDPENEIEPEEEDGIKRWVKDQAQYVGDFAQAVIDARGDENLESQIETRLDMWVKAMETLRGLGIVSAKGNVTGTFKLGSTKEHCETCKALNGTKKRMKAWASSGLLPQMPGNKNFGCGCWECKCTIVGKGGQLYP
jgi:hypothetical protein